MVDFGSNYINALTDDHIANQKFNDFSNQAGNLKNSGSNKQAAIEASKDFEAVFITQLYKIMFDTVKVDSTFGGGHAEETFRSFLMDEYGKITSQSGGIGIAEQVQKSLLSTQGLEINN